MASSEPLHGWASSNAPQHASSQRRCNPGPSLDSEGRRAAPRCDHQRHHGSYARHALRRSPRAATPCRAGRDRRRQLSMRVRRRARVSQYRRQDVAQPQRGFATGAVAAIHFHPFGTRHNGQGPEDRPLTPCLHLPTRCAGAASDRARPRPAAPPQRPRGPRALRRRTRGRQVPQRHGGPRHPGPVQVQPGICSARASRSTATFTIFRLTPGTSRPSTASWRRSGRWRG